MRPRTPDHPGRAREIFRRAAFIDNLGIRLKDLGEGWCESVLTIMPGHLQQDGFVHAGVQATMADHTAGGAAGTLAAEGELVLTVEFKINFLRPARGEHLRCRAVVLRRGRTLHVAESEVYVQRDGNEKLVAKAMVTLALAPASPIPSNQGRET
jgi:uncharacterized protein (TIGR00369 family)